MQHNSNMAGKINMTRTKLANSGFGVIGMILALVALLGISAAMSTYFAQQDQVTAEEMTQATSLVQQAETIRNVIRRCAARMNTNNVVAEQPSAGQPYEKYPGCLDETNDESTGECTLGTAAAEGDTLRSDLKNIWCPGIDKYAFDTEESAFNLKPITGFTPWSYQKTSGNGVLIHTAALAGNSRFAAVLEQVRASFPDSELTEETLANANASQIGIYIFRGAFPGGDDDGPPAEGPDDAPEMPATPDGDP